MTKNIFINLSEKSSVPSLYNKSRDNSGREPKMNGRESAMATAITCQL